MSNIARILPLVGMSALLAISGCATLQFPWDHKVPEASAKNPVVQITCLWEPSEGRDPNGAPCRGFAGQILFLGNKGGTPVKIDGDVTIYEFDDQGTPEEQATPIHQFNFDATAWSQHLRVGSLGPTYHVFIPYTRMGNHEAVCSLRVKYTSRAGSVIYSNSSDVPLRGKKRSNVPAAEVISHYGQRPDGESKDGPRTTTIPLKDREPVDPVTNEQFDQDRANFLLQQFLLEQSRKELDDEQRSSAVRRRIPSVQIPGSETLQEPILAEGGASASSRLSTWTEPAPKRIKGMALRHPLGGEAAFPVEPRVVTTAEADTDNDRTSAESLEGQTSWLTR